MSSGTADSELKARHRAMWASGDYPSMVETFLLPLGPRLVEACGIGLTVLNCIRGDLANDAARLPRVPGHEIVGRVERLGSEHVGRALPGSPGEPDRVRPTVDSEIHSSVCSRRNSAIGVAPTTCVGRASAEGFGGVSPKRAGTTREGGPLDSRAHATEPVRQSMSSIAGS